jgi:hypothetical protein
MCKELDDLQTQWQEAKNNEQLLIDPISRAIKVQTWLNSVFET